MSSSGVVAAAGSQDDEGDRHLAPALVGTADDGGLDHRLVLVEHPLDLGAGDVLAAGDDHVLEPIDDVDVAVVVLHADVAGVEPAAGERRRRGLGIAPVALEHLRAAEDDLAPLARRAADAPCSSQMSSSRYWQGRPTLPSLVTVLSRSRKVSPDTVSVSP